MIFVLRIDSHAPPRVVPPSFGNGDDRGDGGSRSEPYPWLSRALATAAYPRASQYIDAVPSTRA